MPQTFLELTEVSTWTVPGLLSLTPWNHLSLSLLPHTCPLAPTPTWEKNTWAKDGVKVRLCLLVEEGIIERRGNAWLQGGRIQLRRDCVDPQAMYRRHKGISCMSSCWSTWTGSPLNLCCHLVPPPAFLHWFIFSCSLSSLYVILFSPSNIWSSITCLFLLFLQFKFL